MTGLKTIFLRAAAGDFKDSDNLFVRIGGRLAGPGKIRKEHGYFVFQLCRGFFLHLLQKGAAFQKPGTPSADRVLPNAHFPGNLKIAQSVCTEQKNFCTFRLAGRQCPAF